ncbi:hypothetical protein HPB47_018087, partial [Ixodes persulcatus]
HFMTVQYIGHPGLVEDVFPVARLTSPVFRPLTFKACFRFWYKLPCSLCSLRLLVWTSDKLTPVWSTYGPRESSEVNVSLSAISEDFQLVFEARPSRKDITGLVIDDVRLELSECYVPMATEDVPTTIVADFDRNETSTNKEELDVHRAAFCRFNSHEVVADHFVKPKGNFKRKIQSHLAAFWYQVSNVFSQYAKSNPKDDIGVDYVQTFHGEEAYYAQYYVDLCRIRKAY